MQYKDAAYLGGENLKITAYPMNKAEPPSMLFMSMS